MRSVRILVRSHRVWIFAWLVPLILLVVGAPAEYRAAYPSLSSRKVLVQQMQENTMTTALYGPLHAPGTLGQLTQWETGELAIALGAIMVAVLACRLTRADEESGMIELIRSAGLDRRNLWRVVVTIITGLSTLLGALIGLGLLAQTSHEITTSGIMNLAAVIALSVTATGLLALLIAQIMPDAASAQRAGLAMVALLFGIRALADTNHLGALNWLSPLGWREVTQPFTANRWWPFALFLMVDVVLGCGATLTATRRQFGTGLLNAREKKSRDVHIRTSWSLVFHVEQTSIIAWSVAVILASIVFGAMTRTIKSVLTQDATTKKLMTHMTGLNNPVASYLQYLSTIIGILVCIFCVSLIVHARHRETTHLAQWEVCAGQSKAAPLIAAIFAAMGLSLALLIASACLIGGIAEMQIPDSHALIRALGYVIGQWPSCLMCTAIAAFLFARFPRGTAGAYGVVALSATVTIFANLLHLPRYVAELSVFGHAPDVVSAHARAWIGCGILTLGAFLTCAIAMWLMARRDTVD